MDQLGYAISLEWDAGRRRTASTIDGATPTWRRTRRDSHRFQTTEETAVPGAAPATPAASNPAVTKARFRTAAIQIDRAVRRCAATTACAASDSAD